MFVASIVKIKTIDKDVLDSEWTLTSCAFRFREASLRDCLRPQFDEDQKRFYRRSLCDRSFIRRRADSARSTSTLLTFEQMRVDIYAITKQTNNIVAQYEHTIRVLAFLISGYT